MKERGLKKKRKAMEKILHANGNQKAPGEEILTKIGFKTKTFTRKKKTIT